MSQIFSYVFAPFGFLMGLDGSEILMEGSLEDVALLRANVGKQVKVKAAGGISSIADAEKFISLGADRLGTSRLVKLLKQTDTGEGY